METKTTDAVTNLLGIYVVKSPYHNQSHYLPFIILSFNQSDDTCNVLTIEYKGWTSYKMDTNYSKKSIHELITNRTIVKKADFNNFKGNIEIAELIRQYSNAENQLI